MLDTQLLFDIAYVRFVDSDLFDSLFDLLLVSLDFLLFLLCFALQRRLVRTFFTLALVVLLSRYC